MARAGPCTVSDRRWRWKSRVSARWSERPMTSVLKISRLGAQADGIADTDTGPVFVPFTLPGERVNASISGKKADVVAVLEPSPERVVPPCRHFGSCGGCAIQHLQQDSYLNWKRGLLV